MEVAPHKKVEQDFEEKIQAVLDEGSLDETQENWVQHPGDHLGALFRWGAEQDKLQSLINRQGDRERFLTYRDSLPTNTEKIRFRSQLGPLSNIPFRTIPTWERLQLDNAQWLWLTRDRLGLQQPVVDEIKELHCSCHRKTLIGKGRHCRSCLLGGGPTNVHDSVRNEIHAMCRSAGVDAKMEVQNVFAENADVPGDIVCYNMPNMGNGLVIDVTITDSRLVPQGASLANIQRKASTVGVQARAKENFKRNEKNKPGDPTMEERVSGIGYHFKPVGLEVDGAVGDSWSYILKKLSEIAHERRGHNKATFRKKWTARIGMCLAKDGAKIAIKHANALVARHKGNNAAFEHRDIDPLPQLNIHDVILIDDPN